MLRSDSTCTPPSPRASLGPHARRRRSAAPFSRPLARAAAAAALLAAVVGAVQSRHANYLLPVCQLCVSLGGLQCSWWGFRARARLLLALRTVSDREGAHASPSDHAAAYWNELRRATRPPGPALAWLTDRCSITQDRELPVALLLALVAAAAGVALVVALLPLLVALPRFSSAWWLVVAVGGVGAAAAALSASLAPSGADAAVLLVLQGCFAFSRINMIVAHHENLSSDPEVIDDLYLSLSGCCIMVAWRIVSSADVMHTLFAIALDVFVIVYLLATMMEITDYVDNPEARHYRFHFSAFFIAVAASELGFRLFEAARANCVSPGFDLEPFDRPADRSDTAQDCSRSVGAFAASMAAAAVAVVCTMASLPHSHPFGPAAFLLYLAAAAVAQVGRLVLRKVKETALVSDRCRFSVWNNGVMELMNPFLLSWIVVHPFSKHLLSSVAPA